MTYEELQAFSKYAARGAADLLAAMATRKGVDPTKIPAIKQVARIAPEARGRAAEIAKNVRGFLQQSP